VPVYKSADIWTGSLGGQEAARRQPDNIWSSVRFQSFQDLVNLRPTDEVRMPHSPPLAAAGNQTEDLDKAWRKWVATESNYAFSLRCALT
jgi:hypothetical protein